MLSHSKGQRQVFRRGAVGADAGRPARGLVALAGLAAAMCSGCATLTSGTTERIRFESIPPGAQVIVDGKSYTTPVEVTLSRNSNHDVEFVLPDHVPAKRQVLQGTNGWVYGNILIGGLIGMMVDYGSGAANDLEPDLVHVKLVPKPVAREPDPPPTEPVADSPAEPLPPRHSAPPP